MLGAFDHRMIGHIPESDWKVFRELRVTALERLCDRIMDEVKSTITLPGKSSHERYLKLYKLIHDRDRDVGRGFNDVRRSTATAQIGIIHKMGLFTAEELRRFSPQTLQILELYAPIPDA